jgi:AcrR family transcriptional regulator
MKPRIPRKPPERDRERTSESILDAVGRLLARGQELGINSIAKEAKLDKVLIYRYFGGLPELLEAFAQRGSYWPSAEELLPDPPPANVAELASSVLIALGRAIRARPDTQAILRWELDERNGLVDAMAAARERQAQAMLPRFAELDADIGAVGALLAAGLTYLALRSRTTDVYNGVALDTAAGWERLEHAVSAITHALAPAPPPHRSTKRSAR